VVAELAPAGSGDDDKDRGVEEHRQGCTVSNENRVPEHRAYGAAQGASVAIRPNTSQRPSQPKPTRTLRSRSEGISPAYSP